MSGNLSLYTSPYIADVADILAKHLHVWQDSSHKVALGEGYEIVSKYNPDAWDKDLYCVHESAEHIRFYKRVYFKGKPGKTFHLHRDGDKPASYAPNNISYYINGEVHRDNNLPAELTFYEVSWCVYGKWHRSDNGPTRIHIDLGYYYHKNHDLYRRIDKDGDRTFVEWKEGIAQWRPTTEVLVK